VTVSGTEVGMPNTKFQRTRKERAAEFNVRKEKNDLETSLSMAG